MNYKKIFSVQTISFVLFAGIIMHSASMHAGLGRFGAQAVQESIARIRFLSGSDSIQDCKKRLQAVGITERQEELLYRMCHSCLATKYTNSEILELVDFYDENALRDFIMEWSKKHPEVAFFKPSDIQDTMYSMVKPGQLEKTVSIMLFCRVTMAQQCHLCCTFGKTLLKQALPKEVKVLTCEAIDGMSQQWAECAQPLPKAGTATSEEYKKDTIETLDKLRKLEVMVGTQLIVDEDRWAIKK